MIGAVAAAAGVVALLAPLGPRRPRPLPDGAGRPDNDGHGPRLTGIARRVAGAVSVIGVVLVFGPLLAFGGVIAVIGWPRVRRLRAARALRRAVDAALPDAIEMLVLVVHAGMTPHQAIVLLTARAPSAVRPAFAETRRRVERGAPLADALAALPELLGPSATAMADTLAMAERHGTPIAEALSQLARDVRERRQRQAEADARKLPIRMSFPLVAFTLPSFVLIAIVPAVVAALSSLSDTGW